MKVKRGSSHFKGMIMGIDAYLLTEKNITNTTELKPPSPNVKFLVNFLLLWGLCPPSRIRLVVVGRLAHLARSRRAMLAEPPGSGRVSQVRQVFGVEVRLKESNWPSRFIGGCAHG